MGNANSGNKKFDWGKLSVELLDLYKKDGKYAVSRFANKYGMSDTTVYSNLKKLGIKIIHTGKFIDEKGYVRVYIGNSKYAREHRLIMEKKLGRKLTKDEDVHHIDESFEARSNNDPSNLQLKTKIDHTRHHLKGDKGYCISFNKGSVKPWRLRIRDKSDTRWVSMGLYNTEEDALKVVERMRVGK